MRNVGVAQRSQRWNQLSGSKRIPSDSLFEVFAPGKDVDPFIPHIYAALAAQERKMISQRTKAGLQVVKSKARSSAERAGWVE